MNLLAKYKDLFTSDKRYILITGGRGSAKSFHASAFATLLTYEAAHRILFTRYTMASAKISIIPEFESKLQSLQAEKQFKVEQSEITNLLTGSSILFKGIKTSSGNQTASLKSLPNITTWILDEAEELIDEDVFTTIDLSVRSKNNPNRVVMIMNPTTKEHWIWKRWFESSFKYIEIQGEQIPVSTHPDICQIHTTFLDNVINLPEDYVKKLREMKNTDSQKYRHVVLGGWLEKAEGVIFDNWKEGHINPSLPFIYGLDFGYSIDPSAMVKVSIDQRYKKIYCTEIFYEKGLSYSQILDRMKDINKDDLIIADNADPRMIDEIARAGYNIQPCEKGHDSVRMGIASMKDYQIIAEKNSYNLKRELNNYAWNDRRAGVPIDKYNHCIDSLRYAFERLNETSDFFIG